ncbi:MAG: hypothetical protein M1167_04830 [Chloroflexi bacterium]|nr:hypothetical protein [Chloroflexota bacterium]
MTLGFYENFPTNIHKIDNFQSALSSKQLQQKLIQVFYEVNRKEFTFEEVTNPTVPQGKVIFEFGLAESGNFNYIDDEELEKTLNFLAKERLHSMDFFCSIRYYKGIGEKKTPLKFDYYMLRAIFSKDLLEVQVFHERGPRYISPEELTAFIFNKINESSIRTRNILKKTSL